jgi:hypothetical protein
MSSDCFVTYLAGLYLWNPHAYAWGSALVLPNTPTEDGAELAGRPIG